MSEAFKWITENYVQLIYLAFAIISVAEIVVRFTPTEKDDGAVERIGYFVRKLADFLKIPNLKK